MQPSPQDITIYQGDNYDFFFRLRERVWDAGLGDYVAGAYIDLTGWTGRSQIRANATAAAPLAEFAVTLSDQTATPGGVLLTLTPEQTAALPPGTAVWDVELTNNVAEVHTYIAGRVNVSAQVTR